MFPTAVIAAEGAAASSKIMQNLDSGVFNGVLDEVILLLPYLIPVMVGFIAIRKGIAFISSILHSA